MPVNFTPLTDGVSDVDATDTNAVLQELDDAIEAVGAGTKTLASPTVSSFTNATHDHEDSAGGGKLEAVLALKATGGLITQYLRPNGSNGVELATQPTAVQTTKGDGIFHNGTNPVRVAVGSDDSILTADSAQASGVKWNAPLGQGFIVSKNASQGTITTANVVVTWPVESWDSNSAFASNVFTVPVSGVYDIRIELTATGGNSAVSFFTVVADATVLRTLSETGGTKAFHYALTAGQVLRVLATSNGSYPMTIATGAVFTAVRVSDL